MPTGNFKQKNRARSLDKALAKALLLMPTGNFKQKNRARSLDKALAKALLLFPCGYSLGDWKPVVNN